MIEAGIELLLIERLDESHQAASFAVRCHAGTLRVRHTLTEATDPRGQTHDIRVRCTEIRLNERLAISELKLASAVLRSSGLRGAGRKESGPRLDAQRSVAKSGTWPQPGVIANTYPACDRGRSYGLHPSRTRPNRMISAAAPLNSTEVSRRSTASPGSTSQLVCSRIDLARSAESVSMPHSGEHLAISGPAA